MGDDLACSKKQQREESSGKERGRRRKRKGEKDAAADGDGEDGRRSSVFFFRHRPHTTLGGREEGGSTGMENQQTPSRLFHNLKCKELNALFEFCPLLSRKREGEKPGFSCLLLPKAEAAAPAMRASVCMSATSSSSSSFAAFPPSFFHSFPSSVEETLLPFPPRSERERGKGKGREVREKNGKRKEGKNLLTRSPLLPLSPFFPPIGFPSPLFPPPEQAPKKEEKKEEEKPGDPSKKEKKGGKKRRCFLCFFFSVRFSVSSVFSGRKKKKKKKRNEVEKRDLNFFFAVFPLLSLPFPLPLFFPCCFCRNFEERTLGGRERGKEGG